MDVEQHGREEERSETSGIESLESGSVIPARWVSSSEDIPLVTERMVRVGPLEYVGGMVHVRGRVEVRGPVILSLWREIEDGTHLPAFSFSYSRTGGEFSGMFEVRPQERVACRTLFMLVIEDDEEREGDRDAG
jgi:hypothetical protein